MGTPFRMNRIQCPRCGAPAPNTRANCHVCGIDLLGATVQVNFAARRGMSPSARMAVGIGLALIGLFLLAAILQPQSVPAPGRHVRITWISQDVGTTYASVQNDTSAPIRGLHLSVVGYSRSRATPLSGISPGLVIIQGNIESPNATALGGVTLAPGEGAPVTFESATPNIPDLINAVDADLQTVSRSDAYNLRTWPPLSR